MDGEKNEFLTVDEVQSFMTEEGFFLLFFIGNDINTVVLSNEIEHGNNVLKAFILMITGEFSKMFFF